jgi:hypothetical protein
MTRMEQLHVVGKDFPRTVFESESRFYSCFPFKKQFLFVNGTFLLSKIAARESLSNDPCMMKLGGSQNMSESSKIVT